MVEGEELGSSLLPQVRVVNGVWGDVSTFLLSTVTIRPEVSPNCPTNPKC
jgi:hypothetical protein